jgi:hypothetical protein
MRTALVVASLTGCAADLLPGESVLGDEVRAVILTGTPGSWFGAAVSIGTDVDGDVSILIAAPGSGEIHAVDATGAAQWSHQGAPGLGTRVGWADGIPWAWLPGSGVVRLDGAAAPGSWSVPAATAVDVCPSGELVVRTVRGEAVVCEDSGYAFTVCDGGQCRVYVQDTQLDEPVGTVSAGSALGWVNGALCWGDAHLPKETAAGSVTCVSDDPTRGRSGDHLGLAIGGRRTAGVFNRHLTPPRARIVPIDGGEVWVVDRAAERSRIAVDGAEGLAVVGVPGFGAQRAAEGRVYIVSEGD